VIFAEKIAAQIDLNALTKNLIKSITPLIQGVPRTTVQRLRVDTGVRKLLGNRKRAPIFNGDGVLSQKVKTSWYTRKKYSEGN
jgi:hypothetical protein